MKHNDFISVKTVGSMPYGLDTRGFTRRLNNILWPLYRDGLLDAWQLWILDGGSRQSMSRILQQLSDGNDPYIFRPAGQRPRYTDGNNPAIYAIANRGADILADLYPIKRRKPSGGKIDFMRKHEDLTNTYFKHTLLIRDLRVLLRAACRDNPDVSYVDRRDFFKTAPRSSLTWQSPVIHEGKAQVLGITPDDPFRLIFHREPPGNNVASFFYEADCGTEDIDPKRPKPVTIYRKLLVYFYTYELGLHTKLWGIENFRVPIVTTSDARLHHIIEVNKPFNNGEGSELFIVTTQHALRTALRTPAAILSHVWMNGRGEGVTLVD